jgi:osmoprotectant transport system ATP-binding protein
MGSQPPAIDIVEAWKSYDNGATFALKGASLVVAAGEFLTLVGTSGSGKTTLLKLGNRLVEPTSGTVLVDGIDVMMIKDPIGLRRSIGYVFQGVGLFPHMTVAENIAVTLSLLGWEREAQEKRVAELLELARLPKEIADRLPATLSGGQSQRVGVARALAASPRIMLMDEPFGAVDPITRDALSRDYRALHDALKLTTVLVTHDVMEAVLLADRIAVLDEGRIVEQGTPRELLATPKADYVKELMAMPRRQADRVRSLSAEGRS